MDNKLLLVKSITLLFRESQIKDSGGNSADLVRTVIESIKISEGVGSNNDDNKLILALKDTCIEMCSNPPDHEYDMVTLLQRLKMNCNGDEPLYESLEQGIIPTLDSGVCKRSIINLRKSINNYFKSVQISKILSSASYKFNTERDQISDINAFITKLIAQLEPLQLSTTQKDPEEVSDVDIGDDTALTEIFNQVKVMNNSNGIMKTGLTRLNKMLQGGFRRGDFCMIGALQHKYKTGLTLSLFAQIALFNKPYMNDPNKKPLLLRISFEDDLNLNVQFIYQYLKYNETKEPVDIENISNSDMSEYIRSRLQINGYHIKMMRVDPSQWTYRNICNKIIELEAQGYEIHLLMIDYLAMLPTTGCTMTTTGTDIRDLFRRIRNFTSAKKITVITPHQLSTEAKQLIRNGVPEDKFVKEISEKGYFSGSKQLDQELDVELYLHIFKFKKDTYLTLQRGKHRIPSIINDDRKYALYKFPKNGMPIPHDLGGEETGWTTMKEAIEVEESSTEGGAEMFAF